MAEHRDGSIVAQQEREPISVTNRNRGEPHFQSLLGVQSVAAIRTIASGTCITRMTGPPSGGTPSPFDERGCPDHEKRSDHDRETLRTRLPLHIRCAHGNAGLAPKQYLLGPGDEASREQESRRHSITARSGLGNEAILANWANSRSYSNPVGAIGHR